MYLIHGVSMGRPDGESRNLSDLSDLVAVAEDGSFPRAAARLGMSQPALSAETRCLEAPRVGVRLLSNTTRNLAPTDAGARFIEHDAGVRFGDQVAQDTIAGQNEPGHPDFIVGARRAI